MPPGVGPGAGSAKKSKEEKRKLIKRRGDFTAKIMFSSISMTTFNDWMGEKFVDTREANISTMPVTNLAWSQPEGPGYTASCDELIFLDCSANEAEYFDDSSIGNERIQVYVGIALAKLKAILEHKIAEGLYGVVHCTIIGYHPCEKLMFALSELLGNSTAYSYVYSSFIGHIMGQDEYRMALRGVQGDGWKIIVDYVGVFDPYKSEVEDKKGMKQRVKEMEEALDGYPKEEYFTYETDLGSTYFDEYGFQANKEAWVKKDPNANDPEKRTREMRGGRPYVKYDGDWIAVDDLQERHRQITNPNLDEMKKTLKDMESNLEANKKRRNKRAEGIKSVLHDSYNGEGDIRQKMLKEDYEYLVSNSPKYRYDDADKYTTDGHKALKRRGLLLPEYFFEGKEWNDIVLAGELSQMRFATEVEEDEVQRQREAVAAKEEAIKNQKVAAVQILIAIASIPCPWLALVDIAITIHQWKASDSLGTKAMNGAGIAFDIAGLIPYFGTVFKTIKIVSSGAHATAAFEKAAASGVKASGTYEKLTHVGGLMGESPLPVKELEFYDTIASKLSPKQNTLIPKRYQNGKVSLKQVDSTEQYTVSGLLPKQFYDEKVWVATKDINGNIHTTELTYDEAFKLVGDSETQTKFLSSDELAAASKRSQEVFNGGGPKFSGEAVPDLNTELKLVSESEEASGATLMAIRVLTGEDSIGTALEKIINPHYINAVKNMSSLTDLGGFFADVWVRGIGIGYNGISWLKGEDGEAPTAKQLEEQKKKAEAFIAYDKAQNDVFQAQQALRNAKTPEERAAAQKKLNDANKRVGESRNTLGIAETDFVPAPGPVPEKPQVDAQAELKQADKDYNNAMDAYHNASYQDKDEAWAAVENAEQRKKAAQNVIDAQQTHEIYHENDDTEAQAAIAITNWENAYDNAAYINGAQEASMNRVPDAIDANESLLASHTGMDAVNDAETIHHLNQQHQTAQLNAQLTGGRPQARTRRRDGNRSPPPRS